MLFIRKHITAIILAAVCLLTACQSDPISTEEAGRYGSITLTQAEVEAYISTRSTALADFSGYRFTLVGTTEEGDAINQTISFTDGKAIVPAGTYTLTADNQEATSNGTTAPYYSGTSASFTITTGNNTNVSIALGTPQNVRIKALVAESFSSTYENISIAINSTEVALGNYVYAMPGNIPYTIKATAKAGSHATDLPAEGIPLSLNTEAGKDYTINISADALSGIRIDTAEGEHTGDFD